MTRGRTTFPCSCIVVRCAGLEVGDNVKVDVMRFRVQESMHGTCQMLVCRQREGRGLCCVDSRGPTTRSGSCGEASTLPLLHLYPFPSSADPHHLSWLVYFTPPGLQEKGSGEATFVVGASCTGGLSLSCTYSCAS